MKPLFLLVIVAASPQAAAAQDVAVAQDTRSDPTEETRRVVPGPQYERGGLYRTFFGTHYRDLWTAPVTAPVLDLHTFAGGLKPDELGGGQQTRSLDLKGADGRTYVFRSLDKDPTPAVPPMLRETVAHRLIQDAISAGYPGGPLVAARLLRSAGVLHVTPTLVVMPDDRALGKYRREFAGMLGYVEEKADDGFARADEVVDSDELLDSLNAGPDNQVDARAFLRARLMDQLMGDWDRHRDQWKWAAAEHGDRTVWRPIPRDRDQAFVRYDGLFLKLARQAHPKLVVFQPDYPKLLGLTWNGRDLDRRLLSGLSWADFDSIAGDLVVRISDAAIDSALAGLPQSFQGQWLDFTRTALIARRDALPAQARAYYRQLARDVDVVASAQADWAEVEREEDGGLTLSLRSDPGGSVFFERRFLPDETEEVRLYLGGGGDHLTVTGADRGGVRLRVIRDPAAELVGVDAPAVDVHDPEIPHDLNLGDPIEANIPPRDWGTSKGVGPRFAYDPDLGILVGGAATRTDYAFRKEPYGSKVRLGGEYATGAEGFRFTFDADIPRTDPGHRFLVSFAASELDVVRFAGLGNETPAPAERSDYDVHQWRFTVAPAYEYSAAEHVQLTMGPILRYTTTSLDPGQVIGAERPLGATGFGRLGAAADLSAEVPDTTRPEPRAKLEVGASAFAPVWSADRSFGDLHAEAAVHLPLVGAAGPWLALRLGGKRVWGEFPYDEAAFLGGQHTLRGYLYQRFAGDASLYGGAELRQAIGWVFRHSVPTQVGILALADAGRVWADGTESTRVHASAGGGVWLAFFDARWAVSLTAAHGQEGTRWYLTTGLPY
jgi:hypothetical protein